MMNSLQKIYNHNRRIFHMHGYNLIIFLLIWVLPYTSFAQTINRETPPPLEENFRPSMLVVIIVLIVAFFFMGFFSIYIRQCVGRNGTGETIRQTNGGGIGGRSRRAKRGLDPSVIDKFPTFIYSVVKGLKIGKGTLECAVCLNEFEDDETLRLLPKCDHVFHPDCIDAWLVSHTTCPVCRYDLKEVSDVNGENGNSTATEIHNRQAQGSSTESDNNDADEEEEQIWRRRSNREQVINNDDSQEQVLIRVIDDENKDCSSSSSSIVPDLINPAQISMQNRQVRSKSIKTKKAFGKFPRSHSTGHSLIQPGENIERFTLRLPEDVRKQIVNGKLNRTTSLVDFQIRQSSVSGGSTRRGGGGGFRSGSVNSGSRFYQFGRLSKSDHWGFKLSVPSFFTRTTSVRNDGSVKSRFDRLGSKADRAADMSSSARPPV